MTTEVVAGSAKGSFSAVLATSKAFAVAHPIGMAVAGGALLGIGGYISFNRYLAKRKEKRETIKQALSGAPAQAI